MRLGKRSKRIWDVFPLVRNVYVLLIFESACLYGCTYKTRHRAWDQGGGVTFHETLLKILWTETFI